MNQGIMALANAGRGGDTQIAHVRPGELVLPPEILDKDLVKSLEKKLNDAGFEYSTLVVGDEDVSINPRTGLPEFGLFSRLKKAVSSAWKGVKKILDPVTKVAQFIPGPWRAPAARGSPPPPPPAPPASPPPAPPALPAKPPPAPP